MKIRISGNSLRLRLSQGEILEFASHGRVVSECRFADNSRLQYEVVQGDFDSLSAAFNEATITVLVPSNLARNWETDHRVGFDTTRPDGLYILVEKDFQCLKPRSHEDESDLFPNPQAPVGSHD